MKLFELENVFNGFPPFFEARQIWSQSFRLSRGVLILKPACTTQPPQLLWSCVQHLKSLSRVDVCESASEWECVCSYACSCVCVFTWAYVCENVHMCLGVCVCSHEHMCERVCTWIYMHVCTTVSTCESVSVLVRMCVRACTILSLSLFSSLCLSFSTSSRCPDL